MMAVKKPAQKRPASKTVKKVAAKKTVKKAAKKSAKKVAAKKAAGGRPKGTGKLPASADHAPTFRNLAIRLSRDLATVQTWSKETGNPGRDETRQFNVPAWQAWMEASGKDFKDTSEDGKSARARGAEMDALIKEEKYKRIVGDSANINEVIQVLGGMFGDLKQECLTFAQRNSERLAGQDQGALEKILDARMRELLEGLSIPDEKKTLGTSREFWRRVCEAHFPLQPEL